MCKYCEVDMLGDCSDEEFISEDVTDKKGNSLISAYGRLSRRMTGEGEMCLNVWIGDTSFIAKSVSIKFCPFCGEEFKKIPT